MNRFFFIFSWTLVLSTCLRRRRNSPNYMFSWAPVDGAFLFLMGAKKKLLITALMFAEGSENPNLKYICQACMSAILHHTYVADVFGDSEQRSLR